MAWFLPYLHGEESMHRLVATATLLAQACPEGGRTSPPTGIMGTAGTVMIHV